MVTNTQRILMARCYVVLAEVDYDLREWRKDLMRGRGMTDYHANVWAWGHAPVVTR